MYTCPTNEIRSLYLDNELPQNHKEQYEAHIASCEKCKASLEKLRTIREVFAKDAAAITPDDKFMDASFDRLMLKMKYSKTTSRTNGMSGMNSRSRAWKIAIPAIAAAAVLALVIPIGLGAGRHGVKTMSATSSIYSSVPPQVSQQLSSVSLGSENGFAFTEGVQDSFVTNVSNTNGSTANGAASKLIQDVEVFRPNFDSEEKTISIRITIPGNDDVPVTTEIEVPLDVTGQY